eukprot:jgi/Botrbrau1/22653/Bobra.0583s0001.1
MNGTTTDGTHVLQHMTNLTIVACKFEGEGFAKLDNVFGQNGPFASDMGGINKFQQDMAKGWDLDIFCKSPGLAEPEFRC